MHSNKNNNKSDKTPTQDMKRSEAIPKYFAQDQSIVRHYLSSCPAGPAPDT